MRDEVQRVRHVLDRLKLNDDKKMNIKKIYKDHRLIIEKAVRDAADDIYDAIENDENYSLSIDDQLNVISRLLIMAINDPSFESLK